MSVQQGDIYRVAIQFLLENQVCYNVFHLRMGVDAAMSISWTPLFTVVRDKAQSLITTGFAPAMHTLVQFQKITMTGVQGIVKHAREWVPITLSGMKTGDLKPGFVAAVINVSTGLSGRSRRGRMHIGGLVESQATGGNLTPEGESDMTGVAAAIVNNWATTSNQMQFGVWSRTIAMGKPATPTSPAVPPNPADSFAAYSGISYSRVLGSMYSRRIGIGG